MSDVPPEAMLDPVANTLDLRRPFDSARAARVRCALDNAKVSVSDIGYFDNMLHHDGAIREQKHAFMRRVFDAAAYLGVARSADSSGAAWSTAWTRTCGSSRISSFRYSAKRKLAT